MSEKNSQDTRTTRDKILDAAFLEMYVYGYHATGTAKLLTLCSIPKGSLYHHFPSKKALLFSVLKERISPKMEQFFSFLPLKNEKPWQTIERTVEKMVDHDLLMKYGCPLNRLNQEVGSVDEEFAKEVDVIYRLIKGRITTLFCESEERDVLADFVITSLWGALSLNPFQSSKEKFIKTTQIIISCIKEK